VSAGVAASVVMGLFIMTPETKSIYATPALLWGVVVGILYWQARLWLKTTRDEMHDDPLVYALRDRGSIVTLVAIVVLVVVARFVALPLHSS
jgi:uncharacterized membrane protein